MLAQLVLTLVLSTRAASDARVATATQKAETAVKEVAKRCAMAKALSADSKAMAAIDKQLHVATSHTEADFHLHRVVLEKKFHTLQIEAIEIARDSGTNQTGSVELAQLHKVDMELSALDRAQREQLAKGLRAVRENVTHPRRTAAKQAARAAHKAVHPLYSMGDRAEDSADKLNDAYVDSSNCAEEYLGKVDTRIQAKVEKLEDDSHDVLEHAADARDRAVARVQAEVSAAEKKIAKSDAASVDAEAKHATFLANRLATQSGQEVGMSFGPMLLAAICASILTSFLTVRLMTRPARALNTPLLPPYLIA